MKNKDNVIINTKWIVSKRGKKNLVDPQKPYAWFIEKERTSSGNIEDIGIIFLTNKECPFHCLMCDLWKNTTDKSVPIGAILNQIKWALSKMPKVKHLKLYNSGSFFDKKAIPEEDYEKIASLLSYFETIIVESHPKFINKRCLHFNNLLKAKLEVAIGLETVHPEVIKKLNKQMTLDDFKNSVAFLSKNNIKSRAFILLRPPFLSENEGVYWAKKSIDFAFETGIESCTIIPVRAGNGAMDFLQEKGDFSVPTIQSLENVLEYGVNQNKGNIFADVWDLQLFSNCDTCLNERIERITNININQRVIEKVICSCSN
jgi:radical SAM enzyme (TIGR01210 family)